MTEPATTKPVTEIGAASFEVAGDEPMDLSLSTVACFSDWVERRDEDLGMMPPQPASARVATTTIANPNNLVNVPAI